jgi:hypothetical protein
MSDNAKLRPSAPPLPATVHELDALRITTKRASLNDIVERIHRELWNDPVYQKYFWAIWPEETQEGSFFCDDIRAVMMIQEYAKDHDIMIPPNSNKLVPLRKSLLVVLGKYEGGTRKARRELAENSTQNANE